MACRPFSERSLPLRTLVAFILGLALAVAAASATPRPVSAAPPPETGAEAAGGATRATTGTLTASIAKSAPSLTPTGTLQVTVSGATRVPAGSLTVRLRIRRPTGRLVYQRTVTLSDIAAGPWSVPFSKSFAATDLREGRYPLEVQVTAEGQPSLGLADRVYVVRPGRGPVPLVVVARMDYVPAVDPEGRFVIDPAVSTRARDDINALVGMIGRMPTARLSLGIPPLLLDEWRRIISGYQVVGPEGVRNVDKDAPTPTRYAASLQSLKSTLAGRRLGLLDVPFADPDLSGLASAGGVSDLADHYARGASIYQASLGETPSVDTAVLGDWLPPGAAPVMSSEKLVSVLLDPAGAASKDGTPSSGTYTIDGTRLRGLVVDQEASRMLERRETTAEPLLDHLFERLTSQQSGQAVVASIRLGPGSRTDMAALETLLRDVTGSGWVRLETAGTAARRTPAGSVSLKPASPAGHPAPAGYWAEVARARTWAHAFVAAVSERDGDADSSLYQALVAESRYWAGPDGRWSLADRGRAFTAASLRRSEAVLRRVGISSSDITLSGSSGRIPLIVKNDSPKTLQVIVTADAAHATFPGGKRIRATLRPGDNYVTVPVDLGRGGIYDRVDIAVTSDRLVLASGHVAVRASYLDRLAAVGFVILVLGGLLVYIRRKVRATEADNS